MKLTSNKSPRIFRILSMAGIAALLLMSFSRTGNRVNKDCKLPEMPSYSSLKENPKLPDPFLMMNGKRISRKEEWKCRRDEIAALAQEFEYGYKPNTPYSASTGLFRNDSIIVTVNDNGKTLSFACKITYPTAGKAPYPAMIGMGMSNLNNSLLSNLGVAVISFPNNKIANQANASSRGKGAFYDMFGSNHSAGALMAWAWGVSRLIDALEKTPEARIDASRLGVTGCSRNGKGALCVGAYDERIKLTIPQEPGSGGAASWRVSDYMKAKDQNTQTLSQIVTENCWFRENFSQFSNTSNKLPFDQHSVMGLVAPRALLVIENDVLWLGPESAWNSANAAHMIWDALGVPDKFGFSQTAAHPHCAYPKSQDAELTAFVQKFLVGNPSENTTIMKTELGFTFDKERWVDWTVPVLK